MFFALQVDRGNLGQAVSANMLDQLNMNTNDYNYGMYSKISCLDMNYSSNTFFPNRPHNLPCLLPLRRSSLPAHL
jgi:hypothetical protein